MVAHYRDEVPTDTPYALPACVRQSNEPPRSPGWFRWQEAIAQAQSPTPMTAAPDDLVIMPYTSGTTGKPKACMHTHRSALFTAVLQARWYRLGHDDVMTGFMPLFHVAGMQGSMNAAIVAGATLVLMARWDKDLIPDLFEAHGVTFWNAAPTMIVDVLASAGFRDGSFARLKVLTGGGATMPAAVAERLKARFNLDYIEGYGMTETMSPTHLNPLAAPKRQCLGIAVHETDARVIDPDTLEELGDGAVGEIIVHGPQVLQGYWNKPDADASAFIQRDGRRFLRTGDLGYRDAEGYFFAVDRLKRMINVSGFKVWPAEVEAMMYEHPAIRECCVISSPDSYRGETVKALVAVHEAARSTISSGRYPVLVTRQDGELQGAPFGGLRRQPAAHREQQDQLAAPAGCRVESVTEPGIGRRRQRDCRNLWSRLKPRPLNVRRPHAVPSGKFRVHLGSMHRRAEAPSLT